ncbi:MAG: DUF2058 domain-containing protein [Gammaproteobacteria bacterium]|nr:DUF2058 domain-containing protein [Gammaproteobacteria bacterium]MDH5801605.1 DUF2058 domain-containing protein [Gammaproteobacteria bacterium]
MGNSLFDQLKKSGLVDKGKAQKVKHDQYKNKKKTAKRGKAEPVDEVKILAEKAHAEKVERDRQLNQQRKAENEQKAILAQIKQLIETNRIEDRDGDIVFNFTDANVVKGLYVSEQIHKHLSTGRLAIVKQGDRYELVPVPVADKIRQRDESVIIHCNQDEEPETSEDDPYADYKIPDDLMW